MVLGGFLGLLISGIFIGIDIATPEKTYEDLTSPDELDLKIDCAAEYGTWKNGKCVNKGIGD